MNKKGTGGATIGIFLGIFVMALIGGGMLWLNFTQQTALTEPTEQQLATTQETATVVGQGLKEGNAATVKYKAQDKENAGKAQVAPSLYVENGDLLIEDATSLSASSTTSSSTTVGAKLRAVAFNSNFYGDWKEFTVNAETYPITLDVYNITPSLKVLCYYQGSALGTGANDACNMTLASSQTDTFDYMKIEVNASNRAFNLKQIGFDQIVGTNLTITMTGNADWVQNSKGQSVPGVMSETTSRPKRLKSTLDQQFVLPNAIMLHGYDSIRTPLIKVETDGDNPLETMTVYFLDESKFKSSVSGNKILSGLEDDATSPADVGASDYTIRMNIN